MIFNEKKGKVDVSPFLSKFVLKNDQKSPPSTLWFFYFKNKKRYSVTVYNDNCEFSINTVGVR